mgnify:CR=1 FL=1
MESIKKYGKEIDDFSSFVKNPKEVVDLCKGNELVSGQEVHIREGVVLRPYIDRVAKIREVMPHACIGVDVIVGFPGETEDLFLESF